LTAGQHADEFHFDCGVTGRVGALLALPLGLVGFTFGLFVTIALRDRFAACVAADANEHFARTCCSSSPASKIRL
jgi:hypothetical protein